MLSNARGVNQRPCVRLLIVGKLTMIPIICHHSKVWPFGRAPGPLDLLDDMASVLPEEGAGFLGVGVARITLDS
jgi:hypothetical protein